jgi:hypothetical protein
MADFGTLTGTLLDVELNSNDSTVLYVTAKRETYINQGIAEFAALTECYVRRSTLAVSCNTAEYVLSTISDFARISAYGMPEYHLTSSGASTAQTTQMYAGDNFPNRTELFLNRYQAGWRQSTTPGIPTCFYFRPDGGQWLVGFDQRPDVGSSETAKLIVPYVARPQTMASSTDVPFTDTNGATRHDLTEYHQAAVHYAAYKLLPLIGDQDGANRQLQLFTDYVKRFLNNLRPKGGSFTTLAYDYLAGARRGRYGDGREYPATWRYR